MAAEALPSVTDLQMMVPDPGGTPGVAGHSIQRASATLAHTVRAKRAARQVGGDSSFAQDSFFAIETMSPDTTGFGSLAQHEPALPAPEIASRSSPVATHLETELADTPAAPAASAAPAMTTAQAQGVTMGGTS